VGVLSGHEQFSKGYGRISSKDSRAPTDETLFEIGSVTKLFTGLAFALLERKGAVRADSLLVDFFPELRRSVWRDLGRVSLENLITHYSGLPKDPSNGPADEEDWNWLWAYNRGNLVEFLMAPKSQIEPGSKFEYSNLNFGILGVLITEKLSATSYEEALRRLVLDPLEMKHAYVKLSEAERKSLPKVTSGRENLFPTGNGETNRH
jgi:serine-type D-Ala-D-Ala carboxypeptidase/endopeptidase